MNLGFPEMIFIFLLALLIFGPKKLPEIGRQIGKFMAEFRRASNEFKWQIEAEMRQLEEEANRQKISPPTALPAPALQSAGLQSYGAPEGTVMNTPPVLPPAPTPAAGIILEAEPPVVMSHRNGNGANEPTPEEALGQPKSANA